MKITKKNKFQEFYLLRFERCFPGEWFWIEVEEDANVEGDGVFNNLETYNKKKLKNLNKKFFSTILKLQLLFDYHLKRSN